MGAWLAVALPSSLSAAPTTLSARYAPFFPNNNDPVTFTIKAANSSGIKTVKLHIFEYDWVVLENAQRRSGGRWGEQKTWNSPSHPSSINKTYTVPGFPAHSFVSFIIEVRPVSGDTKKEYWGFAAGDWSFDDNPIPIWLKPPTKNEALASPALSTDSSFSPRRINIVFLAQETAYATPRAVLPALQELIFDGYHGTEAITRRKDLWAFHFSPEFGFTTSFDDPHRDIRIPPATAFPANIENAAASVIHPAEMRDFTRGHFFGTEPNNMKSTLHELGHAVFNLGDEYAPGLHSVSTTDYHNNYSSLSACESYNTANGWPASDCKKIEPADWWRPEKSNENCIMLHGLFSPVPPQYGRSCSKRVNWVYDQIP